MKKGLIMSVLLMSALLLTACGNDSKTYAGVELSDSDYSNVTEFEKEARNLYSLLDTFSVEKDDVDSVNKIVDSAADLKNIIDKSLTLDVAKEDVKLLIPAIVIKPKNAVKYSREMTDTEHKLIDSNFKALAEIEAKKITDKQDDVDKINDYLIEKIGITGK
ncbi:hypothetical protein [Listeria rocourtiae]|uniref:hypothetical protein n=1 Tax=Listeria rocourtiae TaxID=647910 RepID=UPI003D2F52E4